jgi:FkbM family methyltransferase
MYLKGVFQMVALMLHFRNGWGLVRAMRAGRPCDEIVLWDGTRLVHPPARGGMLEALVDLWLKREYTGGFYRPADGDVIVDAGANVGLFSILMARQNANCNVLALEPCEENFRCLQANVASACPGNVTCREIALGGAIGRGHMQTVGERSLDHVLRAGGAEDSGTPIITLPDLFELVGSEEIDFLKVDIEGSENAAFRAVGPEVLTRFKRIAVEYHDQIMPGTLQMLQGVLASSHDTAVYPSTVQGCGIIRAARKRGVALSC